MTINIFCAVSDKKVKMRCAPSIKQLEKWLYRERCNSACASNSLESVFEMPARQKFSWHVKQVLKANVTTSVQVEYSLSKH